MESCLVCFGLEIFKVKYIIFDVMFGLKYQYILKIDYI